MTSRKGTVAVGVFENAQKAQQAVKELRRVGFTEEQIGIASRSTSVHESAEKGSTAGTAAAVGAATGAGLGALWGMGIVAGFLPAIGPAIAGGALAAVLSSAAAGATVAGLAGALIGLGIPEEEAEFYEQEFQQGRTVVTVRANGQTPEALAILRKFGAYDASTKSTSRSATAYAQPSGAE